MLKVLYSKTALIGYTYNQDIYPTSTYKLEVFNIRTTAITGHHWLMNEE